MPLPDGLTSRLPLPFVRALVVLGFLAVFYTAASLFTPDRSAATPVASLAIDASGSVSNDRSNAERLLPRTTPAYVGSLSGVNFTLDIYLAPAGPRYTVKDAAGNTLAEQITSDDLYRSFPDLDVDQMHADIPANLASDFD